MFQISEGIKGVHIIGVFENRESLDRLLSTCPINPRSRYVLMEVGLDRETVQDVLAGLGISGTLAGAQYLHDAVTIAMDDFEMIERITKLMYPRIAKMHGTTATRVERAIRVAIEKSWNEADPEYRKKVFGMIGGPKQERPTNTEYIATIVRYLK
ncbi:MAG: sporulation initiation factor Spo0A C-terminal domain-containing protein [Lachnospiraceae bacterium]|nr:sporulation initiation factor Spo0A C-terminal domain-containing protein [Lachnospiraceae bacterium]